MRLPSMHILNNVRVCLDDNLLYFPSCLSIKLDNKVGQLCEEAGIFVLRAPWLKYDTGNRFQSYQHFFCQSSTLRSFCGDLAG